MKILKSFYSTINDFEKRRRMFWALALLLVVFCGAYVFLVNRTVVKVAERDALQTDLSELKSEITTLEFEYISRKNEIDMELASSMGFKEAGGAHYVSRRSLTPALSKNTR